LIDFLIIDTLPLISISTYRSEAALQIMQFLQLKKTSFHWFFPNSATARDAESQSTGKRRVKNTTKHIYLSIVPAY